MKTQMIEDFDCDGLFTKSTKLSEPIDVEIIGVKLPVDPGMVVVKVNDMVKEVPTFTLVSCPKIDFASMLTEEQKKQREALGFLMVSRVGTEEILPINECPVATDATLLLSLIG